MASLAAIAYYAFLFIGGIGFGYFAMRLTKPDSRLMPPTQKLGASAIYGFTLFAIAFALDYAISGEARFLEATGFLPVTLFFTVLLAVFFFKAANSLSKPQYLVVGVPAVKTPPAQMDFDKSLAIMPKAQAPQKTEEKATRAVSFQEIPLPAQQPEPLLTPAVAKPMQKQQEKQPEIKISKPAIAPLQGQQPKQLETPATPVQSNQTDVLQSGLQFEPRAKTPEKRASGTNEFLAGIRSALGFSKHDEGKEAHIPVREAVKPLQQKKEGAMAPLVKEDVAFRESELKKIKEVELEEIARDISGEEKTSEEPLAPRRRYLEKQAESVEKQKEREASPEEDFDTMVQEVYNQLQLSKTRAQVSDNLKLSPPPAEAKVQEKMLAAEQPAAAATATASSSLFSSPMPAQSSAQPSSIFDQLNVISSAAPRQQKAEGDVKFVKVPANGAGCPRCHASNSRIVFCPYCGSGMCANCTPLIAPKEDGFDYSCPKCGENVFVKRQAQ